MHVRMKMATGNYEFDAGKYSRMSRYQRDVGMRLIEDAGFAGGERVLDLGCGDGVLTAAIASRVPQGSVLGIDASANMIDRCLATMAGDAAARRPAGPRNMAFERMDINEIAFESEFDVIFSNAALHWVHDHKLLLANVYRALRPGGRVVFGFAAEGNTPIFLPVVRRAMADGRFARFFADFVWPWFFPAVAEYRQLLAESPFAWHGHPAHALQGRHAPAEQSVSTGETPVRRMGGTPMPRYEVRREQIEWIFRDADEMTGWMDQPCLVPFVRCVDEAVRAEFRDRVVREVLERTAMGDGRHAERFCRIHVRLIGDSHLFPATTPSLRRNGNNRKE